MELEETTEEGNNIKFYWLKTCVKTVANRKAQLN